MLIFVRSAVSLAVWAELVCEAQARRLADKSMQTLLKLLGWGQVFAMTANLAAPGLSQEYREAAGSLDWSILQLRFAWGYIARATAGAGFTDAVLGAASTSGSFSGSNQAATRRRLLTSFPADLTALQLDIARALRQRFEQSPGNRAAVVSPAGPPKILRATSSHITRLEAARLAQAGIAIIVLGLTIVLAHLLLLAALRAMRRPVPGMLKLPRIELQLALFLTPVVGYIAGNMAAVGCS